MEEFTVPLALDDFVTVLFFAIGLYFLWRWASGMDSPAARMVAIGGMLITLGGLSKSTWKLIIAATAADIWIMDNIHFILMAPGFILLAAGIVAALRSYSKTPPSTNIWFLPLFLLALTLGASGYVSLTQEGRSWFFILLGMTTVMNVVVSGSLARYSWREGMRLAAGLYILNIILVFALAGMARVFDRSLAGQWIEQITNNLSYGGFALAGWIMYTHTRKPRSKLGI